MRAISLCSGIGGIDIGLSAVIPGYRTVCFCEREAFSASVLVANMENKKIRPAPIWSDLSTFDGRPWRGKVDILHGGIPCQPHSVAGKRKGDKDPRHIWPHAARIVGQVQPSFVFIENVPGFVSSGGLRLVCQDLQRMGYRIKAGIFSAAECGAPHIRKRIFILGAHSDCLPLRKQPRDQIAACAQTSRPRRNGTKELVANTEDTKRRANRAKKCHMEKSMHCIPAGRQQINYQHAASGNEVANTDGVRELQSCGPEQNERRRSGDLSKTSGTYIQGKTFCQTSPAVGDMDTCVNGFSCGLAGWPEGWEDGISRTVASGEEEYRNEKLRAIGNAVVPIVAANAWKHLMAAFAEEWARQAKPRL